MSDNKIQLEPLQPEDKDQFVRDNQAAFNYGALVEFGLRDAHFEEDGEIISRETIENAISTGDAYRIVAGGQRLVVWSSKQMVNGVSWCCFSCRQKYTAKVSAMAPGVP